MRRLATVTVLLLAVTLNVERGLAHDAATRGSVVATPASDMVARGLDALTRRLLDLHARHERAADADGKRRALRDLVDVAAQRQQRLAALMEDHPGEVIRAALSARLRAALPAAVQPYLEEDVTLEGALDVLHEDRPGGGRYLYWLNLRGSRLSMHFAGVAPALQTGDRVRLRAIRVREALAVGAGGNEVTVLAAAVANTFGAQATAVILVSFEDQPSLTSASPSQAQDVVFGPGPSVSNFFAETSYQQTWLTGSVFGPYVIPVSSSVCDYYDIASAAEQAAIAAGVNVSTYARRVYAFPSNVCAWWGLGTVGGTPSRAWINGSFQNSVVAHEMGHNLGLYHSHALECGAVTLGSSCSHVEYGDTLDVMGVTTPPQHFNAAQKERLGWLNYGASPPITTVEASGVYTIDPYEPPGAGPKALKVRTPAGDWYYVEYRQPFGFDSATVSNNSNVRDGVVVHWVADGHPDGIYLLDMTPATSTWSDPALGVNQSFADGAAGLTIAPVWVNGTNAGVSITVGASPCARANPAVTLSPAAQQGAPGVGLTYVVSVLNNDANCGASSFTLQAGLPAGWTATFGPATLTVAPAATGQATLIVTPPASAAPGTYAISATARNADAPTYAGSGAAAYAVVGPGTPASFLDSFTRADSTGLGNDWTEIRGDLLIQGGQLRNVASRALHAAVVPGLVGSTQRAAAAFAMADKTGGPRFGIIVRYRDPGNYYTCYWQTGFISVLRIAKVVNGAETVLKTSVVANPAPGVAFGIGCNAAGSTLTLEVNGSARLSASDATFATGAVGLFMGYATRFGKTFSHTADDFSATAQ